MKDKKKARKALIAFLTVLLAGLIAVCAINVYVDPFFHYHKPYTDKFYYTLDNQRSQNDGILRHFDYDTVITGSSMTENFRTSELDELFGTNSVKVCFSGATYHEINDNLETALEAHPDLKMAVRGIDMSMIFEDKDDLRMDLGEYPDYLYDDNLFNDVSYLLNIDVLAKRSLPMILKSLKGEEGGITSFDDYSNWMADYSFGIQAVCPEGVSSDPAGQTIAMTQEEAETVRASVRQNLTAVAKAHPDTTFYYFLTPYSVLWWHSLYMSGELEKYVEAQRILIEEVLECDNIRLFQLNTLTEITCDLNNYRDTLHYGIWVNDLILQYMKEDKCRLTEDNYEAYLNEVRDIYLNYDYASLNGQTDLENDDEAAELMWQKVEEGILP